MRPWTRLQGWVTLLAGAYTHGAPPASSTWSPVSPAGLFLPAATPMATKGDPLRLVAYERA